MPPPARFLALLSLILTAPVAAARAADDPVVTRTLASLPAYQPGPPVAGTLRIWGHGSPKHDFMGGLLEAWIRDLARAQPGIRIENHLYGTASAIGALAAGSANLAILGEEIHPDALAAFVRAKGYPPAGVDVATGSLRVRNADYAHVFFVQRDNPLRQLTLEQAGAVFGAEHRASPANLRTWGDLGLTGPWTDRRIQPYGWKLDDDFALYFQGAVLGGSHRWNNAIRQFAHVIRPDGTIYDHGQQIVDALAKDPNGIAISSLLYARSEVRPLALARHEGGPYYTPTEENLISQNYPLTRILPAFFDQAPGRPIDPCVREFLRLVLSREGQAQVARASGYLPLNAGAVAAGLAKLGTAPIRIWGDDRMAAVVARWETGYRRQHPDAQFETKLMGTGTAMAGLYTHQADLGLFGRDPSAAEVMAFEWVSRYRATAVPVAAGSLATPGHSPALAVLVPADNPIPDLSLNQLAAVLGDWRSADFHPIRRWGDLGLSGPWTERAIHLYTVDAASGPGRFLTQTVLGGHREWSWSNLTETTPASAVATLAKDSAALAIVPLPAQPARGVRVVPIRQDNGSPAVPPAAGALAHGTYALGRTVFAVIDRPVAQEATETSARFLRYVLSPEGQAALADDFIPLSSDRIQRSLALFAKSTSPKP